MDVLLVLCAANGDVVSADQLLTACWGPEAYGDNPVHKTIAQLRRVLGDAANDPAYIATIRKRGYRTLASLTFGSADTIMLPPWNQGSPFCGLQAFDRDRAPVFFGRDDATAELVDAACAQVAAAYALQLVLGPSGSGKTSLVLAGLFPSLAPERGGALALLDVTTFDLAEQGEHGLLVTLAGAMLDMQWDGQALFPGASSVTLAHALEHDIDAVVAQMAAALEQAATQLALAASPRALAAAGQRQRVLRFGIFIDRLEALFNAGHNDNAARHVFLQVITRLARGNVALMVLGCRNDYYADIAAHPELMAGKTSGAHFDLAPPSPAEIAQIIRMPAFMAGLNYGIDQETHARLDDVLCSSASSSPDALPLLQYCLQELYRLRSADGELSFQTFHELGGLEGAISRRAEQVVAGFTAQQTAALARVMSLVVVLSANEENLSSRHAPWSALDSDAARQVVEALVESRLFVSNFTGDRPSFGIAHEALLRRWPRLVDWAEAHRAALRVCGWLAQQAARWVAEGRPDDLLLAEGKRLAEAKLLMADSVFSLSESQSALIAASLNRVRRRARLRMLAFGVILALATFATAMGIHATAARQLAEQHRAEAEGLIDFMLGDFVDKLRPLGKLDLLDSVSMKGLEYLKRPSNAYLNPTAQTQRAKALQVIGEVRRARGDTRGALQALSASRDILRQQQRHMPQDTEVLKTLGSTAFWLGQISMDQDDFQQAQRYWRDYLTTSDRLNAMQPEQVQWWIEQSYAHTNLGSLALKRTELEAAAHEFNQSIALKERALAKAPTTTLQADLANTYSFLANTRQYQGELDAASRLYARELRIILHLREVAPAETLWVRKQVTALKLRADLGLAWGQDDQALNDYRDARALFRSLLAQDPGNRSWQAGIANLEQEELRIVARRPNARDTSADLSAIAATLHTLVAVNPKNLEWARWEATTHVQLASVLLDRGQAVAAGREIESALDRLRQLHAAGKSSLPTSLKLVDALLLSAEIERAQAHPEAALAACRQAHAYLPADGASTWDFRILAPWVRVNYCIGNTAAADSAAQRLDKIGYNDTAYRRSISTHQERKE